MKRCEQMEEWGEAEEILQRMERLLESLEIMLQRLEQIAEQQEKKQMKIESEKPSIFITGQFETKS